MAATSRRVAFERNGEASLLVGNHRIRFLQQRDPALLPWSALRIDIVVEVTGVFEEL